MASLLKADLLVFLTDVDGLYTANPNSDPTAQHLPEIKEITEDLFAMAKRSRLVQRNRWHDHQIAGGPDCDQVRRARLYLLFKEDTALLQAVTQANRGTLFLADDHAMNQRKQWMAFYARTDAWLK